jgi:isopenicillin N synthase-like dioxygenase
MYHVATQLISLLAEGLGKRPDYFEPWFKNSCASTLRAINYLPRNHSRAMDHSQLDECERVLVTPEHADSGFITVLSTFGYPGL